MKISELIDELSQYDPNDRVAYAYVTYKDRKRRFRNIIRRRKK